MGVSLYLVFNKNNKLNPYSTLKLAILVFAFLVYLFVGAYVHLAINGPIEQEERRLFNEYASSFAQNHSCIQQQVLLEFVDLISNATGYGLVIPKTLSEPIKPNWVFGGETLFFAFTLLATIGYGHISPSTFYGKLFCIAYITLGVPMSMVLLSKLVERLEYAITKNRVNETNRHKATSAVSKPSPSRSYASIEAASHHKSRREDCKREEKGDHGQDRSRGLKRSRRRRARSQVRLYEYRSSYVHFFAVAAFLVVAIYMVPAWLFVSYTELNWSFLDSIYYSFVSVTTIGFGDLVPGQDSSSSELARDEYRLIITSKIQCFVSFFLLFFD
jgi:hypothetical protein